VKPYKNTNRNAGIIAYETGDDFIKIKFNDGKIYLYNNESPGKLHVKQMKLFAQKGSGLTTYINQYVRDNYASKL
jgi:hypothetical protein